MIPEEYFGQGRSHFFVGGLYVMPQNVRYVVDFAVDNGDSGTADAAVTTTNTTLTDTRESWTNDEWVGSRVFCNGLGMLITSNDSDTVTGGGWQPGGGNPGNGFAWSIATDAVQLPDARTLQVGTQKIITDGSITAKPLDVLDKDGFIIYPALQANETVLATLLDNQTAKGSWHTHLDGSLFTFGALIPESRETFALEIDSPIFGYNVRDEVDALGYSGANPAQVSVVIRAQPLIGATTVTPASSGDAYAFETGVFPALSSISLRLEPGTFIWGNGGNGGDGGLVTGSVAATDGADGGPAMKIDTFTTIQVPQGALIMGGGGGGGGGAFDASGSFPGDGGGGSGGAALGFGGASGGGSPGQNSVRSIGQPEFGFDPTSATKGEQGTTAYEDANGISGGKGGYNQGTYDAAISLTPSLNNGQDGGDTATQSGGLGGLGGDAIHNTVNFVVTGPNTADNIRYVVTPKMRASATITMSGTVSGL